MTPVHSNRLFSNFSVYLKAARTLLLHIRITMKYTCFFVFMFFCIIVVLFSPSVAQEKPGTCPVPNGVCAMHCRKIGGCKSDSQCSGALKCCPGMCCNRFCEKPLF